MPFVAIEICLREIMEELIYWSLPLIIKRLSLVWKMHDLLSTTWRAIKMYLPREIITLEALIAFA